MDIQHIGDNLFRIPVPVPFPMKYVFCYLYKGEQSVTLIDAGFNYPPAQQAWLDAFANLDVKPEQVEAIYLTHFHPDHFGLAGWLQEVTQAPVYIHSAELEMAERVWGDKSEQAAKVGEMCRENGVPAELAKEIVHHMEALNEHVFPLPKLERLTNQSVSFADGEVWQMMITPGHSDGHTCFYQQEKGWFLAGDHLLDKITPNISLWPGCRPNPLADYFDSLQSVAKLPITLALPAHGGLIHHVATRANEIVQHHHSRLQKMLEIAGSGRTAYEVASEVFNSKQLTPHQWRFALAETLAHLEYLAYEDRLIKLSGSEWVYKQK